VALAMSGPVDDEAGVTAAFAAGQLGIKPNLVSNWARRGWLTGAGVRRYVTVKPGKFEGQTLYRFGDILDAEGDTAANPNSYRGVPRPGAGRRAA